MPQTGSAPTSARWTIAYQRETTQQAPQGGFVQGVQIGFTTTRDGVTQSVFVPYNQYTPDRIKQIINSRVDTIEAVHSLQG